MIPQELISREEVIKIVNDSIRLHTTPMGELINSFFEKRISKLQTHEDRVREVIEKQMKKNIIDEGPDISAFENEILQELLNELYPTN